MKKHSGTSMKVMLALLAVLLVSLGYLSSQTGGREGMSGAMPAGEEMSAGGAMPAGGQEKKKNTGASSAPPPPPQSGP